MTGPLSLVTLRYRSECRYDYYECGEHARNVPPAASGYVVCGRVLGKKPEIDGVLLHEARSKLAVKFHPLPGPFGLVLLVSFPEDG